MFGDTVLHVVTKTAAVFHLWKYLFVKMGSLVHHKFIRRQHRHYLPHRAKFGCRKRTAGLRQGDESMG